MANNSLYLKPNVVFEPLFDNWYAWAHLIPPVTAALNVTHRHLKIMNSYIQAPLIHAAAVKNPKLLGGPFMDYEENKAEEIRALRERTLETQAELINLSQAIKDLHKLLKEHAKGYSLEPLYDKIPPILKGYVELLYDLNDNPSFRVYEFLLYKSRFYRKESQSIALWLTDSASRSFCLSTARLDMPDILNMPLPFDNPLIDELSRMKRAPADLDDLIERMGLKDHPKLALFRSFFTTEAPAPYRRYEGDKIRMRYFGHACILIETKDLSILIDPLISYYGNISEINHYSDLDLPEKIDYILITHNHQDHILFETLLPLRHKVRNIIVPKSGKGVLQDPNLKLMFNAIGFHNILELDEFESIDLQGCQITGIPFTGEHSDLDIKAKLCYHVTIGQFTMLFVADSRIISPQLYEFVHREIGEAEVIFLGMECDGAPLSWLYGPLLPEEIARDKDNTRRLSGSNYEKGMHLIDEFNPKEVYVYAMGQEPWVEFISSIKYTPESNPIIASDKLIEECTRRGILAERFFGEKELFYEKHPAPALPCAEKIF
ncbi:MAG TPA: MBL fold metallo-hydrolase [Puia sp.]|nr:MBL fold metallo-hydrolase [Puia sp.]